MFNAIRVFAVTFGAGVCDGQSPVPTQPYTLHAYTDLVQVPTMVLTPLHASYPNLSPDSFSVSFDNGPATQPRHVRLEGDDPLLFAVLLDLSQTDERRLTKGLLDGLERTAPPLFNDKDRVSVFASDCALVRFVGDTSASTPILRVGVSDALASKVLHPAGHGLHCGARHHLWDVIATTITQLQTLPGRRVLLVLSDGVDQGSKSSWAEVRRYAVRAGVTVVGIRPAPVFQSTSVFGSDERQRFVSLTEDVFALLCGETGGITFYDNANTVDLMLRRVLNIIRNRYILDFQRPTNATRGDHTIDVSTADKTAIIRVAGATFPLRDQKLADDPSAVPTNLSTAPQFGERKILNQPR